MQFGDRLMTEEHAPSALAVGACERLNEPVPVVAGFLRFFAQDLKPARAKLG